MSDERPIGIFDSGVGGLSVLREVRTQLPAESCIYLADSREAPYGTKPAAFVRERARRITEYLLEQGAKVVLVACNTASVVALADLRARFSMPFVGIVPAVKPAAQLTRSGRVGVLVTPVTAESEPLAELIVRFASGARVLTQECPELVPLVEAGELAGPRAEATVRRYVEPLLATGVDVLVLGCTHYVFLRGLIEDITGPDVTVLDPAAAVARQLGRVLAERGLCAAGADAEVRFATTGDATHFQALLRLLGETAAHVEQVAV